MFHVRVVLSQNRIQFEPSYDQLEAATNALAQDTAKALLVLPRLTSILLRTNDFSEYASVAAADKDVVKQIGAILQGLLATDPKLKVCCLVGDMTQSCIFTNLVFAGVCQVLGEEVP